MAAKIKPIAYAAMSGKKQGGKKKPKSKKK